MFVIFFQLSILMLFITHLDIYLFIYLFEWIWKLLAPKKLLFVLKTIESFEFKSQKSSLDHFCVD